MDVNLWQPERCNCELWAWVMAFEYGGRIVRRWSYVGWWPHAFWSPDGLRLYEYVPLAYHFYSFPPLIFKGRAQEVLSEKVEKTVVFDGKKEHITLDMTGAIFGKLKVGKN